MMFMKVHLKYGYLFLLALFFSNNFLKSQTCEGNLGENIFFDGDFGSGFDNNLLVDPLIAPGYTYTTSGPPFDGFYVLTNNTGAWSNFQTWLNIQDNSLDTDGYMMVVNASFDPGIFYEQTISGFCENTIYEFSADIINIVRRDVPDHIKPDVDFLIDGVVQYSTGDIPQDETWTKYGFTFIAPTDRTEITLTLRNNAPGGIGNDLALDNISFRACGPQSFINTERTLFFCEESNVPASIIADVGAEPRSIQWQFSEDGGINWISILGANDTEYFHNIFEPGEYKYRYLSAGTALNLENVLCRVISDELTIFVNPIYHEIFDTICQGNSFQLGDQAILESGTYMAGLTSNNSCDSNVTLNLMVVEDPFIQFELEASSLICASDTNGTIMFGNAMNGFPPYDFFYNGAIVNNNVENLEAGQYSITAIDRHGCEATQMAEVLEPTPFLVNAGPDIDTVVGALIQLNASANGSINQLSWSPDSGLDCADCLDPVFVVSNDIAYILRASNEFDCEDSDTLLVSVNRDRTPIFIPNVFSPNGDNINDILSISSFAQSVAEVIEFSIFDRWGGLRYQLKNFGPNDPSLGWDGFSNSKKAPIGVYVYYARLRMVDGNERIVKGDVSLIR